MVKKHAHDAIHASLYGDDGYIWVNEVINFEGGDQYAIRVIHPNMASTEGQYLSTNMKDIAGNLPYLSELEGVREKGEIFQTYYFKNRNDNRITEKASFAKLYRPFGWIIASGEPLESVMVYANELSEYNQKILRETLWNAFLGICIVFGIDIAIIILANRFYQKELIAYIDTETKLDPLTGVLSRKTAEPLLIRGFEKAKTDKTMSMLMVLDIDHFKKINDTYGHDVGDLVLKKVAEKMSQSLRKTDHLVRWGGEEFVILFHHLPVSRHYHAGQDLLQNVHNISFESQQQIFNITISIGSSYFHDTDKSYLDALKRADIALYHSKNTGRNRYTYSEDMT